MDPTGKQALKNAQKLIIVTTAKSDLDALFAAFALAVSLTENGKDVKLLLAHKKQNQVIFSKLSPNLKKLLLDPSQKIFKISLKGADFAINHINWQRVEDDYNIYLSSENEISSMPELKLDKSPWPSDLIIAVGIEETDTLLNYQLYAGRQVEFTKTLGIGPEKNKQDYRLYFSLKNSTSVSITAASFLLANGLPLNKEAATYLLAGLYWKTDSFKYHVQDDFATADFLIKKGAVQKKAKVLGLHNLHFHQLPYFRELFNNFQLSAEGIYYSVIAQETKRLGQELFNDLIPLADVFDAKVAFVVLEDELFNTVYLKSNISDFNLLDFVKSYNGEGNHSQAYFISSLSTGKLVEKLSADLNQVLNRRQRKVEDNLAVPGANSIPKAKNDRISVKKINQQKREPEKNKIKGELKSTSQKQNQPVVPVKQPDPVPRPGNEQRQQDIIKTPQQQKPSLSRQNRKTAPEKTVPEKTVARQDNPVQNVQKSKGNEILQDPLTPATSLPQPLKFGNEDSIQLAQPIVQTPLAPRSG